MTREDIENNVGYWQEKANLEYVNQCLERGVTDFTEIDRAFDAGFDKGYQYAIDKACEFIRLHIGVDIPVRLTPDGEPLAEDFINKAEERVNAANKVVEQFKRFMEG